MGGAPPAQSMQRKGGERAPHAGLIGLEGMTVRRGAGPREACQAQSVGGRTHLQKVVECTVEAAFAVEAHSVTPQEGAACFVFLHTVVKVLFLPRPRRRRRRRGVGVLLGMAQGWGGVGVV